MAQIPKGLGYVNSVPFFLKIGALVVLLIGLGTLGTFLDKVDHFSCHKDDDFSTLFNLWFRGRKKYHALDDDHWGKKVFLDFGISVIVVSWIIVILMVVLFITGLHEKISVINWPLAVAINMLIWGVLLFIAGCFIADAARAYDNKKIQSKTLCDWLDYYKSDARCGHLIGATMMCFITTFIFGVDAFFNFQIFRGKGTPSTAPPAVPT